MLEVSVAVFVHLGDEDVQEAVGADVAAEWPEPTPVRFGEVGEQVRRRSGGVAPVQQLEAGAALQQSDVVDQLSAGRRVDEGVLEQPEDPAVGQGEGPLVVGPGERQIALGDVGERVDGVGVDAHVRAEIGAGLADRGFDEAALGCGSGWAGRVPGTVGSGRGRFGRRDRALRDLRRCRGRCGGRCCSRGRQWSDHG